MELSESARRVVASSPDGFTVNPRTGETPREGYMVAMPGHETRRARGWLGFGELADDVFSLPDVWLGGWLDSGSLLIEPSVNVRDLGDALLLGRVWGQVSVWDVANERELDPATGVPVAVR